MSNQCFKNKDFDSRYFALKETEDQVLQLELTSAVAPLVQTENAITRFNDPVTDDNGLKNSTVILDDDGNITDANSVALTPISANPAIGAQTLWINSSDGNKLYRNNVNLENPLGSVALNDLSDVTITTPALGDTLLYNGVFWQNLKPITYQIINLNNTAVTITVASVESYLAFPNTPLVPFIDTTGGQLTTVNNGGILDIVYSGIVPKAFTFNQLVSATNASAGTTTYKFTSSINNVNILGVGNGFDQFLSGSDVEINSAAVILLLNPGDVIRPTVISSNGDDLLVSSFGFILRETVV